MKFTRKIAVLFFVLLCASISYAQTLTKDFTVGARPQIEIENRFGQVRVVTNEKLETDEKSENKILLEAISPTAKVLDSELVTQAVPGKISVVVNQTGKRIDLILRVPARSRLKITGLDGVVEVIGNFESAEISTNTGTIYADIPVDTLRFNFLWTESRARYLSDFLIPEPKEKAGGKFEISGKILDEKSEQFKVNSSKSEQMSDQTNTDDENIETDDNSKTKDLKPKTKNQKLKDKLISLRFVTKRGVILLNVPPSEVPFDLRERPLTEAAKAIVRSGDSILSEAVRRAAPKYFNDYLRTLPPRRAAPRVISRETPENTRSSAADVLRRINLNVSDRNGRAINNLKATDFILLENGEAREIVSVELSTTPFNLVLLLDVSGSVEERIDFIRKAARNFVNTVGQNDKLAIITFRDDVQVVSDFTIDKNILSQSLDTFDAGGGTAVYDALGYILADTLRQLRTERTAIVILSDGDDNRSFIPFDPLLGAIQESGVLVYPLYVPSGLIPNNGQTNSNQTLDPLRTRYLTLTTKAEREAKQLAEVSGGVYFPIKRLEDLQNAYEDVVAQLRTAYTVTYRSKTSLAPRLRFQVKREGAFVRAGAPFEIGK